MPRPVPAAHLSFIRNSFTFPFSSQRMILQSCPPMSSSVRTDGPYMKFAPRAWQAISVIALSAKGMLTRP
jgi:hypothetical protein